MKVLILLILIFALNSCKHRFASVAENQSNDSTSLTHYQQYAKAGIIEADVWDQAFPISDSFHLWSWDDFGKEFKQNRITRTYHDGFYRYTFWTRLSDTILVYAEDSIPVTQLILDSMFDANGDGSKDLVSIYNPNNGKCPPDFTLLFLMDTTSKKFKKNSAVETIRFAKFHPK